MMRYLLALILTLLCSGSASADGVLSGLANPPVNGEYLTRQVAQFALTSTTSDQAIFTAAQDTLTMISGVYDFKCQLFFDNMSATSGNAIFKPLGTGTATITGWHWFSYGIDAASGAAAAAIFAYANGSASAASIMTATTATRLFFTAIGTFDMTVGGTMIPQIGLVTAASATTEPGSYCRFTRLAPTGTATLGAVN